MNYQEFIKAHTVAADYRENKNGKCETVQMVSVENAEKACRLAMKGLAKKLLEMTNMNTLLQTLSKIRDEKI